MQNFKDEEAKENEKSKGICGPDMWYSPRGKSCPCVILMIFLYIILLPFIIILAFSIALWYCLSTCYTKMFMTGMNTARVDWSHFHKWWNKTIHNHKRCQYVRSLSVTILWYIYHLLCLCTETTWPSVHLGNCIENWHFMGVFCEIISYCYLHSSQELVITDNYDSICIFCNIICFISETYYSMYLLAN